MHHGNTHTVVPLAQEERTHTHHNMSMHDVSFAPQLAEASAWSPSSVTNSCPSLLVFQEKKRARKK